MKSLRKLLLKIGILGVILTQIVWAEVPLKVTFEARLATTDGGSLRGSHVVQVWIKSGAGTSVTPQDWTQTFSHVIFTNGICSLVLGNNKTLTADDFKVQDPHFVLKVTPLSGESIEPISFPIPSTPYAVHAQVAEDVAVIRAESIVGTFNNNVIVSGNVHLGNILHVIASKNSVGINTRTPSQSYALDINGKVNASGYYIGDEPIESKFTWKTKQVGSRTSLYYILGNVGVGTSTPQYNLDVAGTINANEYLIGSERLIDKLNSGAKWLPGDNDTIYWNKGVNQGKVGIGVSQNLKETLEIAGALRIGKSAFGTPKNGTIEYDDVAKDFLGWVNGQPKSLTGIQVSGSPNPGELLAWESSKVVKGVAGVTWINNSLGIGTSNPTALLSIQGTQNQTLLQVQTTANRSALIVQDNGNVGVLTSTPSYALDVNGIVNAKSVLINGLPINKSFSDPFWVQGTDDRIYYTGGFVGIGTSSPRNLLEVSSPTGDAAITFDIAGTDLFTMGVSNQQKDTFVISQGSDLTNTVFSFNSDRIGVGVATPNANFHVHGNTGFLITGKLNSGEALPTMGAGTRMLFYPGKAAFRAGGVSSDQWDGNNIGEYSVALGENGIASGYASVVMGGSHNSATGNYSTVLGGKDNRASGAYSVAAGTNAHALHSGTFIWNSNQHKTMSTSRSGQFVINAEGGMGINTSDTSGAVLTVHSGSAIQRAAVFGNLSSSSTDTVVITNQGGVGIGTTSMDLNTNLAVAKGNVGIGTTDAHARLTIANSAPNGYAMQVLNPSISPTRSLFVVTASGNVGIGITNPTYRLHANGTVFADQFVTIDSAGNQVTLQPSSGSPWADPSKPENNNNTYRAQGFIGIGTPSPNSLLELSNRNSKKARPEITFDLDGVDYFTMGVITDNVNASQGYLIIQSGGTLNRQVAALVLHQNRIGVGITAAVPSATLHVSGNTIISGNLAIGTTNVTTPYRLLVEGPTNVTSLNVNGAPFTPSPSPWKTNQSTLAIYYTSGNVGVGTTNPTEKLVVNGTARATQLQVTNPLVLNGALETTQLSLQDKSQLTPTFGAVFVDQGLLKYRAPGSTIIKNLSSVLQASANSTVSGPIGYWVNDSTIGRLPLFWDASQKSLALTGNIKVSSYKKEGLTVGNFIVSSNVVLGASPEAMLIDVNLSHQGAGAAPDNYSAQKINVNIDSPWGSNQEKIIGLDVAMASKTGTSLLNNAEAVGIRVDVSSMNVASTGKKYAAVFLGGNVGIGTDTPQTALEVNGMVSANSINISGGLNLNAQLKVNDVNNGFIVDQQQGSGLPRVGIGTLTPQVELEVNGVASINTLVIHGGLESATLNIGNGNFYVNSTGNIGIGITNPTSQISIRKIVSDNILQDYIAEKINIELAAATQSGFSFALDKNLTGLDVIMKSQGNDQIAGNKKATGINVDLQSLKAAVDSDVIGLKVDVSGTQGKRYAAIFQGGRVGIGTANPTVALAVSGDIKATNLILAQSLSTNKATFNTLVVNQVASLNRVSVNSISVLGTLKTKKLTVTTTIDAPNANINNVTANNVSVNTVIANTVSINVMRAQTGLFEKGVGVGTTVAPSSGLQVSGSIKANVLHVTSLLELNTATLNINSGGLFMGTSNNLGIGTTLPLSKLHVHYETPKSYTQSNTDTWNAIRLQTQSNVANAAVGIVMVPDSSAPSGSIGSGIVAIRNNQSSSSLAFITDPAGSAPKERMRISHDGFVGVGLTNPQTHLHVSGNMKVSGIVTVNGTLYVAQLKPNTGTSITINTTGKLVVNGAVSANKGVEVEKGVHFAYQSLEPTVQTGYGALYAEQSSGDLIFKKDATTTINITKRVTGMPNKVPYIDAKGNLSDTAHLYWSHNDTMFQVGTANVLTQLVLTANVTANNVDFSAEKVNLVVKNRSGVSVGSEIVGMQVNLKSSPTFAESNALFGRLADGETAYGLQVDTRDLIADYSFTGTQSKAYKYSAVFLGGNVGVGVKQPQAALHVVGEVSGAPLRVDTITQNYALYVDADANVGIGTSLPTAKLHIKKVAGDSQNLVHIVSGNQTLVVVKSDGKMGIGHSNPSTNLHVSGVVSANTITADYLNATTLNVGSNTLVVDSNGNVGIGTSFLGTGQFVFNKEISSTLTEGFISQKMVLELNNPGLQVDKNLTGIYMNMKTGTGGIISKNATGVSVNMTNLKLSSLAKAVGVNVDVSGIDGNRIAALFQGGYVGIGLTNPSTNLHVSGDIKATNMILSGAMQADHLTTNRLVVNNDITINGVVTVNTLVADLVSANAITVEGTLTVSTASFQVVTVNNRLYAQIVGVGNGIQSAADSYLTGDNVLYVSGNTKVSGNLDIVGVLTTSKLQSSSSVTINSTTGSLVVDSGVSVNGALQLTKELQLVKQNNITSALSNVGQLYINNTGELVYVKPGSTVSSVNITNAYSGQKNRLAYYNASGKISSDAPLYWFNGTSRFQVGTQNVLSGFEINTTVPVGHASNATAHLITMNIGNRTSDSSVVLKGLDIALKSSPLLSASPSNFGRLAAGETGVGLYVDVQDLVAKYSTNKGAGDANTLGVKYAAAFMGGNVGVGTSQPKAAFHVEGSGPLLRVDTSVTTNALVVTANGYVGMGTANPDAVLTIQGNPGLHVKKGTSSILYVSDKVGVGTTNPTAMLHVNGGSGTGSTNLLNLKSSGGGDVFIVKANGNIGIGTNTPSSKFHLNGGGLKVSNSGSDVLVVDHTNRRVGINRTPVTYPLEVDGVIMSRSPTISGGPSLGATERGFLAQDGSEYLFYGTNGANGYKFEWGSNHDVAFKNNGSERMRLKSDGKIGIGVTNPSAKLHVNGDLKVGTSFSINNSGDTGIGIDSSTTYKLRVAGTSKVDGLTVTGTTDVGTLNADKVIVTNVLSSTPSTATQSAYIDTKLGANVTNSLIGLEVKLSSKVNPGTDSAYFIKGPAKAYGVRVDVSGLKTVVGSGKGNKYAGAFMGGNVGIGTNTPKYPLHVVGNQSEVIAGFSTSQSQLLIRDYGEGIVGFNVLKGTQTESGNGLQNLGLVLNQKNVGIGTTQPVSRLNVNGDVRVGIIKEVAGIGSIVEGPGYGNKLIFSGGPRVAANTNGDNGDELFIARYNRSVGVSELHMNMSSQGGTLADGDRFLLGYKDSGTFKPVLTVEDSGNVGIRPQGAGTSDFAVSPLHVKGKAEGNVTAKNSHLVVFENTGTAKAHTLALVHSGVTGTTNPDHNFVTFMTASGVVGEIEGNLSGNGVRYKTTGADYAEYLQKSDVSEPIEKGDILGVIHGKVSKNTHDAQQLMVRSSAAAVAGNWPGEDKSGYELVAFFGQVQVKVVGSVNKGDYIIPSGAHDGTGVAVSSDQLTVEQKVQIVGRAWQASSIKEEKLILCAVGLNFTRPELSAEMKAIEALRKEVDSLEKENRQLATTLESLDKQDKEIQLLLDRLQK